MTKNINLYEILGVSEDASEQHIKKVYRECVRKIHPDKGGDKDLFQLVTIAFEILSKTDKRKEYDDILRLEKQTNNFINLKKQSESFYKKQEIEMNSYETAKENFDKYSKEMVIETSESFDIEEKLNNLLLSREQDDIEIGKLSVLNPESFDTNKFNETFQKVKSSKESTELIVKHDFPSAFNEIEDYSDLSEISSKLYEYNDKLLMSASEIEPFVPSNVDLDTFMKQREEENKQLIENPKFMNSVNYYRFMDQFKDDKGFLE
jgi:curved DNA-binding protein CbpA